MNIDIGLTDDERVVVLYFRSRGVSKKGISSLLNAKIHQLYPESVVEQMIKKCTAELEGQHKYVGHDTQGQEQEWDLDVVNDKINSISGRSGSGRVKELIRLESDDAILNVSILLLSFLAAWANAISFRTSPIAIKSS